MKKELTYLELSEADGVSHKFYEVIVEGETLSIRYGRIGDRGKTQVKTYSTPEKAQAEANKKISQKLKKGYEKAVMGVRKKRPITRRTIKSQSSTCQQAPVIWQFNSGSPAFGIFVNDHQCWVGNQDGLIFALNLEGNVHNQYRLPDGVKCIVADESWLYAGCDNGCVYDLTGKVPRTAYTIAPDVDIFWLDICDGILGVSDADGNIITIDHEEETQWQAKSRGVAAWMIRCDSQGVYAGDSQGLTMYNRSNGKKIWNQPTKGDVLFGWQEKTNVYAGTSENLLYSISKKGKINQIFECDASIYSCATSENGEYLFAGDNCSSIYCFNDLGQRLWKLGTGCGSAFSMQFCSDKLYIVTTDGILACIDASLKAIEAAQRGNIPQTLNVAVPNNITVRIASNRLEVAAKNDTGVIVECFRKSNKLKIRVVTPGYNSNWNVQFPRDIRKEGSRYLVEEIRPSSSGQFYRAFGEIKEIK